MTRVSARTDRQRCRSRVPASPVGVFALLALLFCCSVTTPAAAAVPVAMEASAPSAVRTLTPVTGLYIEPVAMAVPVDRGLGTSCHGGSTHSAAVVLPVASAPLALPSPVAVVPTAPLTGAAAIRGPSHDGVHSVDQLRLQVQRI
ncbi:MULTISPECIES: hypothetical protein [Streptomyces]|uniref:Small secreted domain DUF320 n=1 Tax=Streptomyces cavourensis TaxID=67258 RepID=A0AAD0VHK4_9ACTN|nr:MULTISPECIES: hypothetical protein [Streptomyces]NUW19235.1 hypothetical protein [Streptomyces roseoviolaceus]ATY99170.1 hypothetical protein CVT27_29535 [Streptomyces cavourensis]AXI75004.1 hypothetical protein DTW94_29685 [Streptomyces cavourensis]MBT3073061.1 hypothetical protein [Streptomyces sp. COG21]MBT3081467.1 hypothetical protein [Streptomyces sp. COG20]